MRRTVVNLSALTATLALGAGCAAAAQAAPVQAVAHATAARGGQLSGLVTAYGRGQITIRTPGRPLGVINALTAAADRITAQRLPYVWGGGHGQAGVPSIGDKGGPGANGRRIGYDCSGAVAAVLVGAGLWPAGHGVPNEWGMIKYLLRHRLITPGAGAGPREVTLYDRPGVHIFMNIDGRFWGTSDGGAGANPKGGPGWLDDGAIDVTRHAFRRYHFRSAVLRARTRAAYSYTFELRPALRALPGLDVGTHVRVAYSTSRNGTMIAGALHYAVPTPTPTPTPTPPTTPQPVSPPLPPPPPAPAPVTETASGTLSAIASGDSGFTVTTPSGQLLSFTVTPGSAPAVELSAGQLALGAEVTVTYTSPAPSDAPGQSGAPAPTADSVTVDPAAAPPPSGGAPA